MDQDGRCNFASIRNLAHRARMTEDACSRAVAVLESPDPDSADPDNEGRRIERVLGGWTVLNAGKYRELATCEQIRESNRVRQQRFRDKQPITPRNGDVTLRNARVTGSHASVTQSEAEAYTEAKNQNLLLNETLSDKHGHIPLAGPIYDKYPRHQGKAPALKAITKQYKLIARSGFVEYTDRHGQPTRVAIENEVAAAAFLEESVAEFADSPAGVKGEFVPYPATWFNQARFTDDRQEWYRNDSANKQAGREAHTRAIIEELVKDSD